MSINSAHLRFVRIQKHIHQMIRADVRKALGPQSPSIRKYYATYKRELKKTFRPSEKDILIKEAKKSDILLIGDYHTFSYSQKAALKLLSSLFKQSSQITLALEMIPSEFQEDINAYLQKDLSEDELLEKMDYFKNWGFPWHHFKPLLQFALDNSIPILGLNLKVDSLESRDRHAAKILAQYSEENPEIKIFTLYGDLHIANTHIPKFLKTELNHRNIKRRVLRVFQNSDEVYWKLANQRLEHKVNLVRFNRNTFCIMNAAPWVKLQSYLQWVEHDALMDTDEDASQLHLQELAQARLQNLLNILNLKTSGDTDFHVKTMDDLSSNIISHTLNQLPSHQHKIMKYMILRNRTFYLPQTHLLYLSSNSINAICEGVTQFVLSNLSKSTLFFSSPKTEYFGSILCSAFTYFGSKILNHRRKCDLEEDFKVLATRPLHASALPQEKLQKKVSKFVLQASKYQERYWETGILRTPLFTGPNQLSLFLETTRALGNILGEKLYLRFIEEKIAVNDIEQFFQTDFHNKKTSKTLYIQLLRKLKTTTLEHTSKADLL